jgi:hypothetical protein
MPVIRSHMASSGQRISAKSLGQEVLTPSERILQQLQSQN